MRPAEIPGFTRVLGKPIGWTDEQCGSLAVRDIVDEDGPAMQSWWTPDDAERAAIAEGASVQLHICGTGHPPVSISVVGPVPAP